MADPIRQATSEELAYCAGIIDGEGCISMFEQNNETSQKQWRKAGDVRYRYKVKVKMVDHEACALLMEVFGGSLYWNPLQKLQERQRFATITWTVSERRAAKCIRQLLPYLRIKQKQAELLLLMADNVMKYDHVGRGRKVAPKDTALRHGLIEQVRAQNQRVHLVAREKAAS